MSPYARSWWFFALVSVASLAAGYLLPRPARKGGDLLDAVAAVQRRCPLYLSAEPGLRPESWVTEGGIYLSRTRKTADDLDHLVKDPSGPPERWRGIVYFKACTQRDKVFLPFLPGASDRVLDYGDFAVFGDHALIAVVRAVLAEQGFEPACP